MPSSNRSGTVSDDGSSLSGRTTSSSPGSATSAPRCGPKNLYGEQVNRSAPRAATSTGACGVRWTPSTWTSAPTACAAAAMVGTSGRVPSRLEAPVSATSRVRSESRLVTSAGSSSPVVRSNPAHRTVAPTDSAASTHGRMLASWSSRVTTTSSPAPQPLARARARSKVSWVIDRPNTTPPAGAPSRSATAARAPRVISSARRSASVTEPRLASPAVIAPATASATCRGTCDPPGPSKCATPRARAGKAARTRATSRVIGPERASRR